MALAASARPTGEALSRGGASGLQTEGRPTLCPAFLHCWCVGMRERERERERGCTAVTSCAEQGLNVDALLCFFRHSFGCVLRAAPCVLHGHQLKAQVCALPLPSRWVCFSSLSLLAFSPSLLLFSSPLLLFSSSLLSSSPCRFFPLPASAPRSSHTTAAWTRRSRAQLLRWWRSAVRYLKAPSRCRRRGSCRRLPSACSATAATSRSSL